MDTLATAALVVLAAVSILWTVILLALAGELRRTTQRLQEFLRATEAELLPALADVRLAARRTAQVADDLGHVTPHLAATLGALEEVTENVRGATALARSLLGHRFIPVAGILAGIRAGLRFAWRRYGRRRES